jgi:hypothetical protein
VRKRRIPKEVKTRMKRSQEQSQTRRECKRSHLRCDNQRDSNGEFLANQDPKEGLEEPLTRLATVEFEVFELVVMQPWLCLVHRGSIEVL